MSINYSEIIIAVKLFDLKQKINIYKYSYCDLLHSGSAENISKMHTNLAKVLL